MANPVLTSEELQLDKSRQSMPVAGAGEPDDDFSMWATAAVMLSKMRVAVWTAVIIVVVAIPIIIVVDDGPMFSSSGAFVPQSSAQSQRFSAIMGMAAQYGFAVPGQESAESPFFYADLLQSRQLLGRVVGSRYRLQTVHGASETTLLQLYGKKKKSPERAREAAIKKLASRLDVRVRRETSVVQFSVAAPTPALAQQIAMRLIEEVQNYNLSRRRSGAAAERRFIEERLTEARRALNQAESALEAFLTRNRQFEQSPSLRFAYDRLARNVAMRQQLVTALAQSFEEARIAEVRNTPVISIVEDPERPVRRDPRGRLRNAAIVLLLAVIGGLAAAFFAGQLEQRRAEDSSYRDFESALNDLRQQFPRLLRRRLGAHSMQQH